ncbi:uncharacterized protein EAF02_003688 [Botrytis sinoallii]|uniref:uncharacterized protein n=1 Tax=Botrytis sinoallii TaxID=1463999 RepID=UPI001901D767|nr:uncharacterized protein EAF02_003688 [Botrytis sinoallii]KAF7887041.1 hypothetical protein EAF02_003688 [Botrytis sinoallii]
MMLVSDGNKRKKQNQYTPSFTEKFPQAAYPYAYIKNLSGFSPCEDPAIVAEETCNCEYLGKTIWRIQCT